MNYKTIIAAFGILSLTACGNQDTPNNMEPTPGQKLDTAIEHTRQAGENTKSDMKEFGDDNRIFSISIEQYNSPT